MTDRACAVSARPPLSRTDHIVDRRRETPGSAFHISLRIDGWQKALNGPTTYNITGFHRAQSI